MEIKCMDKNQGENTALEESIERKLREAEISGCEVEFDPDEAELIAFKEDALSDEDARESIIDL
jgi:ribosomal protein S3